MPTSIETLRLAKQGDIKAIEQVINDNSRFVRMMASRFRERDDAFQNGLLGLLDAIEHFDCERGVTFLTYAKSRIWTAMIAPYRRKTDENEMFNYGNVISLNGEDDIELSIPEDKISHEVYRRHILREQLYDAIDMLEDIEKMIIVLRYFEGHNQSETARKVKLSQQMVSRYEVKAIKKLKGIING